MRFAHEDLSDGQFENLIVFLWQRLLGMSVQGYAKGPDGGRDAKFVGTAELHASEAAPWVGTTIIQAKHTNGYNCNFSEIDFFSTTAANTVLAKEIARIKKLRRSKQLDRYILFANRRLAGNAESEILDESSNATSADQGHTYRKLLCIVFDMSLLRAYLDDEFPRFAYQDGVFESLDDRKKGTLLAVIRRYAELGLQPVITLLDSDLPTRAEKAGSVFDKSESSCGCMLRVSRVVCSRWRPGKRGKKLNAARN